MATTDPLLGRLVDGRYEVRSRIARGGMAMVYLAHDRRLERDVALKVMHPHLAEGVEGAEFVSRFRREARAAARLTHPGVVAVYDQGLDGDTSYLTMEYVPGSTLRRELRTHGTLTVGRTLQILEQVLAALAAAHRKGLVHRDVKPENVLITSDGEHVKVADFGLARAVTEVTSTTTGTILGTVAYLAPEVIATGGCDARTDLYAVGILAYETLTGALPHSGSTPIQVAFQHVHDDVPPPSGRAPWLPAPVDALVGALTARDPASRPADGGAALELVRHVHLTLAPEVLERRAEPPVAAAPAPGGDAAGVTPDGAPQDATLAAEGAPSAPDAPSDGAADLDDTGELDAIPAGVFATATPGDGVHLTEALLGTTTERVVEQRTVALDARQAAGAPSGTAAATAQDAAPQRPRRRRAAVAAALALLLALGGGTGTWWWFADGPGAWTRVPSGVAEVPLADAQERLAAHRLDVVTTEAYSDDVPEGAVVEAVPAEGEQVRKDGRVRLVVSLGVRMLTVPDGLAGQSQEDATAALTDAGFTVADPQQDWSDTVPRGQVLSVSEEPGTEVPHDRPVTLTVSGGPAPVTVTQQVGRERDEARAALEDLGLHVEFTEDEHSETVPKGTVLRQDPADGTQAHRLDTVRLTVSAGPPVVQVPDVVGMRSGEARRALQDAGLVVEENRYLGGLLDTVRFQDVSGEAPKGSTVTLTVW
ncbi:Stk1 family PASTA domain-containing Ser/Thr kinase [Puerhibacterium puerhi]|uniref:Stk1 family PASTA domain-containing Ser/Thr kinase n=1 Tax=Puerhibacterium puerhi TaxID=2692623 RepID=UPI001F35A3F4|nr:Stk1 family PASTA domain-containing Ser/Thr kinase [Puerhibacterium puerhi]